MADIRAAVSSQFDERYAITRFAPVVPSREYQGAAWVDPFDPRIEQLLAAPCVVGTYDGATPLTTLAHRVYGTTSADWLFLLFNGAVHPHELGRGPIRFPIPAVLDVTLKRIFATPERGRDVVV